MKPNTRPRPAELGARGSKSEQELVRADKYRRLDRGRRRPLFPTRPRGPIPYASRGRRVVRRHSRRAELEARKIAVTSSPAASCPSARWAGPRSSTSPTAASDPGLYPRRTRSGPRPTSGFGLLDLGDCRLGRRARSSRPGRAS
ncbi:MAG: hypothetical protein M0C28_00715 [Candidatus Moduliflexus flocculans]|nr:hypothetical protein [Candidatus Moduliflexus flocculans]